MILEFFSKHDSDGFTLGIERKESIEERIAVRVCFKAIGEAVADLDLRNEEIYKSLGERRTRRKEAINPLELAMEALQEIQLRFYRDFPPHPKEEIYGFATPSTIKPTQWSYPGGGVNQIPGECTISGDVSIEDVTKKLQEYVDDINANIEKLGTRGPVSKYVLPDENLRGRLTISYGEAPMTGVACNLDSRGFHVLCKATKDVVGHVKPYSITGSLPLIRELQDEGFDVQTAGYGLMATYHAKNEYCLFSDMSQGFEVFVSVISQLEDDN
ncbi:hypothetical protein AQUCO_02600400v1 [Aquilegia coerulea]|uniref:Peptidase M20 dimerisation domain-containing protein n=1 Tax=Aquilegia coerulea TaxID=218851 RepID=A0A2G5D8S5_AQUCA|nr:hypothetical protein AQUCO_02600400v1 [Aquilegia coerulea]